MLTILVAKNLTFFTSRLAEQDKFPRSAEQNKTTQNRLKTKCPVLGCGPSGIKFSRKWRKGAASQRMCRRGDHTNKLPKLKHVKDKRKYVQPIDLEDFLVPEVEADRVRGCTSRTCSVFKQNPFTPNAWNCNQLFTSVWCLGRVIEIGTCYCYKELCPPTLIRGGMQKALPTNTKVNRDIHPKYKTVKEIVAKSNGSQSKNKKANGVKPPVGHVQGKDPLGNKGPSKGVEGPEEGAGYAIKEAQKAMINQFMVAKHHNGKALFDTAEEIRRLSRVNELFRFDCYGSPYCGYACIDVATKNKTDVAKLFELSPDDPLELGSFEMIGKYGATRQVNVLIFNEAGEVVYSNPNSPNWKWVAMTFEAGEFENGRLEGHFTLKIQRSVEIGRQQMADWMICPSLGLSGWWLIVTFLVDWFSSAFRPVACYFLSVMVDEFIKYKFAWYLSNLRKLNSWQEMIYVVYKVWYIIWMYTIGCKYVMIAFVGFLGYCILESTFVIIEVPAIKRRYVPKSGDDVRSVVDKRDPIVWNDSYVEVEVAMKIATRPDGKMHDGKRYIVLEWITWLYSMFVKLEKRTLIVSEIRFLEAYKEMQMASAKGIDPLVCLSTVGMLREVNTDITIGPIFYDTAELLKIAAKNLKIATTKFVPPRVAFNAYSGDAYRDNENEIAFNQGLGYGGCSRACVANNIKRFVVKPSKKNRVVAQAPLGPLITDKGVVGPGLISLTDSAGLLSAFTGRSMSKIGKLEEDLCGFVNFSKKFLNKYINSVVYEGTEPDKIIYFKEMYKGKKTQSYIDGVIHSYEESLVGRQRKKFSNNSCFVKFESNVKKGKVKPRLIMTMSDQMLVDLCPIMELLHAWAKSEFKNFQIKEMTPIEMIDVIAHNSYGSHVVTDYSSFEASIDRKIREIENYVMIRLCERFGFWDTRRSLLKYAIGGRELKTRFGSFQIQSRCSGDFWTSSGNGIVNVCIMAWCYKKKFGNLEGFGMVAEGDDGLVRANVPDITAINDLGFKFSTEVSGTRAGDCDFLRCRWVDGKKYMSVGRALRILWVKKNVELKYSKQCYLIRCAANSMWHTSPGHPVLTSLVKRILKETQGVKSFKGWERYVDKYKRPELMDEVTGEIAVDESMRELIASGATGFPPISISDQIVLERMFETSDLFYISTILNDYDDIIEGVQTNFCLSYLDKASDESAEKTADLINQASEDNVVVFHLGDKA